MLLGLRATTDLTDAPGRDPNMAQIIRQSPASIPPSHSHLINHEFRYLAAVVVGSFYEKD